MPGTEKEMRAASTLFQAILWFMKIPKSPFSSLLSHCPSENSKAACAGSCSESVRSATGVLTGVVLDGGRLASTPGEVFS